MSLDSRLKDFPSVLRNRYLLALPEIRKFQANGHELREKAKLNPLVEHNALTREMHEVEYDAVKFLCKDVAASDPKVKLDAWKWVLKQDWGKDLRASPYEQRYWSGPTNAA